MRKRRKKNHAFCDFPSWRKVRRLHNSDLLPDAEIAEDHVQQIFDIHNAADLSEAAQCETEVFGAELGQGGGERPSQRGLGLLERLAVPRSGQNRSFGLITLRDPLAED